MRRFFKILFFVVVLFSSIGAEAKSLPVGMRFPVNEVLCEGTTGMRAGAGVNEKNSEAGCNGRALFFSERAEAYASLDFLFLLYQDKRKIDYYPFGSPIAGLSHNPAAKNNPYLREGKEYLSEHGWDKYDQTGRTFDTWKLITLQVDPLATKYYGVSPYALWLNNPMRVIDPTGMEAEGGEAPPSSGNSGGSEGGWKGIIQQLVSFFGIGVTPNNEEEAREYAERTEALQNFNADMQERMDKAQEVADYIPFVGAAFRMSFGAVNDDNGEQAMALGMFMMDVTGGSLLKGGVKTVSKMGSQLLLKSGAANLTQHTLEHIVARHWFSSGAKGVGKFLQSTTASGLKDMINTTTTQGVFRPNTMERVGTMAEYNFDRIIGTTSGGKATSNLRVIIAPNGNVITAFPF